MDTVAKFLVEDLLSLEIDTYFGIAGGPICTLFEAIVRTPEATLIEAKHETAALFEAIGYYKVTGKTPIVVVSAGPGITNCLTGIASAKALRIPLIVICGDVSWEKTNNILLQNGGPEGIDIEKTFEPHAEKVLRLNDPHTVSQHAINFLSSRKGNAPSIFILPLFAGKPQIDKPNTSFPIGPTHFMGKIDPRVIDQISSFIRSAKRPLLLIGNGTRQIPMIMTHLVNELSIPFMTTAQGKGIVSETNPFSLRHTGLACSKWSNEFLKEKPDILLVMGSDLDDCSIGMNELADDDTRVIHIDLDSKVFNRRYKNTLGIIADIGDVSLQLIAGQPYVSRFSLIEKIKQSSPHAIDNFEMDVTIPIAPHRALADLEKSVGSNVRFVTDIGEHMLFCLHYLTAQNNNFSIDLGLGSMGSGIGQAIGMCLGDRKPTICICGDGGFQMHGFEILTAIKQKLPIIFAIFNDARYNMVHHGFKFQFGREVVSGDTDYIDFAKMGEAMGTHGYKITQPGEITSDFLNACFNLNLPVILDIRINRDICLVGAGRDEALKTMGGS